VATIPFLAIVSDLVANKFPVILSCAITLKQKNRIGVCKSLKSHLKKTQIQIYQNSVIFVAK